MSECVCLCRAARNRTSQSKPVTRVRNDAGTVTPIEFSEVWQSADTEDHVFFADYPIGDNVFLESVRVRNLKCTCEDPTQ